MRRVVSLFSGVGLLDLGLCEGADLEPVAFAEREPFAKAVLRWHHPDVPVFDDVADVTAASVGPAEVVAGGFPCQPVSAAGLGLAQGDPRWLWPQMCRVIGELRPELAVMENVQGLLGRGLHIVLGDLARLGYSAEWDCLPALAVGAPHLRYRVFIVARRDVGIRGVFAGASAAESLRVLPPWPDEAPFLPRLKRDVPLRRERLTALGNGVVAPLARWVGSRLDVDEAPPLGAAFATFDGETWREGDGGDLFGASLELDSAWSWPRAGAVVNGSAYELPPLVPFRRTRGEVWPTPSAAEPGWSPLTDGRNIVTVDGDFPDDWDQRFYNRETGQIVQKGLTQVVEGAEAGLWPTPMAADGDRQSEQGPRFYKDGSDNPTLLGAAGRADDRELYPTPTASDAFGSRRATARRDDWTSNPGTTLTDAAWIKEGVDPHTVEGQRADGRLLWPTPTRSDGVGGGRSPETWEKAKAESGGGCSNLSDAVKSAEMWPTPSSRDHKGPSGAGFLERRDGGPDLAAEATRRTWPTPKASPSGPDFARAGRDGSGGDDLATAVVRDEQEPGGGLNPAGASTRSGWSGSWVRLPAGRRSRRSLRRRRSSGAPTGSVSLRKSWPTRPRSNGRTRERRERSGTR